MGGGHNMLSISDTVPFLPPQKWGERGEQATNAHPRPQLRRPCRYKAQ